MTENPVLHTPQQALAAMLDHYAPCQILHVGNSDQPALTAYAECHPECRLDRADAAPLPETQASQRYDLALFVDCLEHMPKRSGLELLGSVRNLNAARMAVLVDLDACDWQTTDFYALALQVSERFERDGQTLTLFTYDLLQYKQVPDWLNARFWANPEMFGKYWW
ncbi:DUF6231 family protein [Pseudomonas stutzeri]|uniref:Class I SAM-dependent methyltransferase n=1 Tax=Stutzerimonas stutzeri TaxID=316 RepID=A0A2N8S2U3_STUST|nr:DUF6231 family protein [Stutzerimonas stutzeri]MCQ4296509.1 DUF6231 family protein [Stutzerimonas stutzeri]PNF80944.1 hypothetical protein CXK92_12115 [Stutzerimonas stutzeri]